MSETSKGELIDVRSCGVRSSDEIIRLEFDVVDIPLIRFWWITREEIAELPEDVRRDQSQQERYARVAEFPLHVWPMKQFPRLKFSDEEAEQ